MSPQSETAALVDALREHLARRRIEQGFRTLEAARSRIGRIGPGMPGSGVLLGLLAQWVDAGYAGPELLRGPLDCFPPGSRSALPLSEYLHVRMTEGVLAMFEEDFERAESHFRFIQSLEGEIADPELLAIATFWTGRCLRKTGRYDDAVSYTAKGETLALASGYGEMAAIMQMSRSWLAFQQSRLSEALALLRRAEAALSCTDDFLNRGNVQSAYGRIARRQGRYEQALECSVFFVVQRQMVGHCIFHCSPHGEAVLQHNLEYSLDHG
ncbi:MAG: hypothetical protein LAQ30_01905 [Acidobacteriia bacterium]|nr:hypothetical protein [Terriglobia bacterium]